MTLYLVNWQAVAALMLIVALLVVLLDATAVLAWGACITGIVLCWPVFAQDGSATHGELNQKAAPGLRFKAKRVAPTMINNSNE